MNLKVNREERYDLGQCIQDRIVKIDDEDEKNRLRSLYDRLKLVSILEE